MEEFIILALATWRLALLLVEEEGPRDIIGKLRVKLGVRYDNYSVAFGTNVVAEALVCVWCMSIWVGLAVSVLYFTVPTATLYAAFPLALSAAAVLCHEFVSNKNG